jgi:hypothetical protein
MPPSSNFLASQTTKSRIFIILLKKKKKKKPETRIPLLNPSPPDPKTHCTPNQTPRPSTINSIMLCCGTAPTNSICPPPSGPSPPLDSPSFSHTRIDRSQAPGGRIDPSPIGFFCFSKDNNITM